MELIEATIIARGHQKWIDAVTSGYRAKIKLFHSKPSGRRDEVLQLFEITVDQRLKDKMLTHLVNSGEISELEVTESSHGRVFGLIRAKGVIMRCISESDCFLTSASGEYGAPIAWKVLGTKHSLGKLMARLKNRKISYKVSDIAVVRKKKVLTMRQEWLLRSAFEHGYFDYPKRIRIRSLASQLGVTAPTLHESLRKTQRRLIEEHFESERTLFLAAA